MVAIEPTQTVPITIDDSGTWRVGDSRVTVEVVLGQFNRGSTPEQIQDDFATLSLAEIYGVISFCLSNPEQVDSYLEARKAEAAEIREKWESRSEIAELRQKLRQARDDRAKAKS